MNEVANLGRLGCGSYVAGTLDVDGLKRLGLLAKEDGGQVVDHLDARKGRGQGLGLGHVADMDLCAMAQARCHSSRSWRSWRAHCRSSARTGWR